MLVLLVEDQEDCARALSRALVSLGHDVNHAPKGEAALRLCRREEHDIMLIDLGLPDMDGWALLRRLRLHTGAPAIAVSGYCGDHHSALSLEAGFVEHLVKPVDIDALAAAMRRAVATGTATVPVARIG